MAAYISEFDYYGSSDLEFVEVAVATGTDLSGYSIVVYDGDGYVSGTYTLGTVQGTISGQDVYLVNDATPGFSGVPTPGNFVPGGAAALVDNNGNVLQFLSYQGGTTTAMDGPAAGQTSTNAGTADTGSLQSNDGGNSYFNQAAPNAGVVPCYAPGTMIATPDGPRAVETLSPGDLVNTLDHGPQPVRWIRQGMQALEQAEPHAKPVLVQAGALGDGLPLRDLVVSPQHRILVGSDMQLPDLARSEAFVPAKSLTGLPGIRHMQGKTAIIWIHFACDRHEVVYANGCLSESLLLGPEVVNGLTGLHRRHIAALFPDVSDGSALNGPPARPCVRVQSVRRQLTPTVIRQHVQQATIAQTQGRIGVPPARCR